MSRTTDQKNPWTSFPATPPYVLDVDRPLVEEHNARRSQQHRFRLDLLPEPYMGPADAPVVLLNLNPGFAEQDIVDYSAPDRQEMMRQSLTHELADSDAFYFLADTFEGTGGGRWWKKRLAPLIRRVGVEAVSGKTQVIEHVPYKSRSFHDLPTLPSQGYSFSLVRNAISRDALIVVMRKYRSWIKAVPELEAANVHQLRSPQNVTIGPGNCPTGFDVILERMSS
ncbi:MAG: hypothetical protein IH941_09990 [Acidobacteria bacterium]|nr:hypothetical protein [Acidobacteriota bacterium]